MPGNPEPFVREHCVEEPFPSVPKLSVGERPERKDLHAPGERLGQPRQGQNFWAWVGAALPLEIAAMLLYMLAIRDSPLAMTLPYLAFTPVLSALVGFLLLGETITLAGLSGILLVVAGAYFLNIEHARGGGWSAPLKAIVRSRGSRLMLIVAVIYSATSVIGKGALQYVPALTFGAFYFALLGVSRSPSLPSSTADASRRFGAGRAPILRSASPWRSWW